MRPPGETTLAYVERLAGVWSLAWRAPIGRAECGCPNRSDGTPPETHICLKCGYVGLFGEVHEGCEGCGAGSIILVT